MKLVRRWERLRWRWKRDAGPVEVDIELRPSSINLPRLMCFSNGEDRVYLALSWGNGKSDPVWTIEVGWYAPAWLVDHLPK